MKVSCAQVWRWVTVGHSQSKWERKHLYLWYLNSKQHSANFLNKFYRNKTTHVSRHQQNKLSWILLPENIRNKKLPVFQQWLLQKLYYSCSSYIKVKLENAMLILTFQLTEISTTQSVYRWSKSETMGFYTDKVIELYV